MRPITIGMAAHTNEHEVWFTLQALRMYHDLTDVELLVVDNGGTDAVAKATKDCRARYERYTQVIGTAAPRNKVFELAKGQFTLCIDSHVFLAPRAVTQLRWWLDAHWDQAANLIHGPMLYSSLDACVYSYLPQWRGQQWGIWGESTPIPSLPAEPIELDMMACGLMGCRTDAWLGFHPEARGFGGVEGILQRKYQQAGRKVLCLPFLRWLHCFMPRPHRAWPLHREDKVRNYTLGFRELGMDKELAEMREHFGVQADAGSG